MEADVCGNHDQHPMQGGSSNIPVPMTYILFISLNVALELILFQSHQRLPSYQEAVHNTQIPDLLQDEPAFRTEHDNQNDDFAHRKYSSPEGLVSSQRNGSFEQDKGVKRVSCTSSYGSHSSTNTSLEKELPSWQQDYQLSDSPNHSPLSSLERSLERSEEYIRQNSHRSSSGSSHSSTHVPAVQSPLSPDTREGIWERLYEEGDEIPPHNLRHQRRTTVASSAPSNHIGTELLNNGSILNGTDCNIAEFIDPTFNRRPQHNNDKSPPSTLTGADSKPKPMPIIQPHRRRTSDKKKKDKEKECKQQ